MREIKKIRIFDFDGTVMDTPLPDTGRILFERKIHKQWPHKGWWSKPESLDAFIFDIKPISHVFDVLIAERSPDTLYVLMTGRITKLENQVKQLLSSHNLQFDRYFFNTKGDVGKCKLSQIKELISEFSEVTEIEMWEDRPVHIELFREFGKTCGLERFEVIEVKNDRHG